MRMTGSWAAFSVPLAERFANFAGVPRSGGSSTSAAARAH